MAKTRSTFCCPNCFSQFQKDDSVLRPSSGAAVSGEGSTPSGKLDRDIDKVKAKRVKYCKTCGQPFDFHALLQGKLDYRAWGPLWAVLAFLLMFAVAWFWLGLSILLSSAWRRLLPRRRALRDRGSNAGGSRVGALPTASWLSSPRLRLESAINSDYQSPAMLLHLTHDTPLWVTGLILTIGAAAYGVGLTLISRWIYGVDRLKLNNEVAGFKFAVVGVFYAVMLAFVVIAVWEDFRNTENAVRDEAKAAVDLHRLSFALPIEGGADIRKHLINYVNDVREFEWRTMAVGEPSDAVVKDLDRLSQAVFAVKPEGFQELALYQNALRLLAVMTDNRNERLDSADGSMPSILWFVLVVGGLITLGYPAFFGTTNLLAQALMTAALAELVALSLLLGLALDYPFTGEVHISAFPFDHALRQMPPNWPPP